MPEFGDIRNGKYDAGRLVMTETRSGLSVLHFTNAGAFKTWLAKQPRGAPGLWVKFAKKASTSASLTKAEAIDIALCHGWIDGQLDKYDDMHWLVRFTPRKPRSKWSAINRKRALELVKEGLMRPAGLSQIEAAKADGRWESAYAPAKTAEIPDDLQKALNKSPKAAAFFATLNSKNRFAILYRIGAVKKAETRTRKITEFVAMLERRETIH
jgi:uncharacterized protein YdeI (YjbR/CyaY-like superfamily)